MKTGFKELDEIVDINKGNLIIIGGRPAIGKSTFGLNIISNVLKQNKSILMFSLESSKESIISKLISIRSNLSKDKIVSENIEKQEIKILNSAVNDLENSKLYIDDTIKNSIEDIEKTCIKEIKDKNINLIVIDYMQLVSINKAIAKCEQDILDISIRLKELSENIQVPIIVISQLSHKPEERKDHRPRLTDFENSKGLVEKADVVLLLYREYYYNLNTEEKNVLEVKIAKNRDNKLNTIKLIYMKDCLKISNL